VHNGDFLLENVAVLPDYQHCGVEHGSSVDDGYRRVWFVKHLDSDT